MEIPLYSCTSSNPVAYAAELLPSLMTSCSILSIYYFPFSPTWVLLNVHQYLSQSYYLPHTLLLFIDYFSHAQLGQSTFLSLKYCNQVIFYINILCIFKLLR